MRQSPTKSIQIPLLRVGRLLALAVIALLPSLGQATCTGQNLLETMPPAQRTALAARAAQTPFGNGLLWRATKGDTTLTVFGTYHVPHPKTQTHFDRLKPLIAAADILWLEMNADDTAAFQRASNADAGVLFVPDGPTLATRLGEADWQTLRRKMSARGFPSFMTAKMKPIFASMMLGLSPCQMRAMHNGEKGIDQLLAEAYPARSLEPYMTTLTVFDSFSPDAQIDMLRLSLDLPVDPDDMLETMYQAYAQGQIALLWEYGRDLSHTYGGANAARDFAQFEQVLLTDRNLAWIDRLLHDARGHTNVIAVGAAHLPGDHGVLNLLAARGFTLTPLPLT